ncbi:YqzE family protein [Virgibacillus halotolerans]|uniref:YqzE family protein n=1 Tax=Virgibacillus halotolerans TaxID=1071053 RepID=UPI0030B8659C
MIIISGNDYLKFVTEQVVTYIDMPPDERKKRKTKQKDTQGMYVNRWFGVLPFVFKIFFRKEQ